MKKENIFQNLPINLTNENFKHIINTKNVVIDRIVSHGHSSPSDFWYDQEKSEWVLLLLGQACLVFEKGNDKVELNPGDYVNIPAHVRHRVESTDSKNITIWLAIHY